MYRGGAKSCFSGQYKGVMSSFLLCLIIGSEIQTTRQGSDAMLRDNNFYQVFFLWSKMLCKASVRSSIVKAVVHLYHVKKAVVHLYQVKKQCQFFCLVKVRCCAEMTLSLVKAVVFLYHKEVMSVLSLVKVSCCAEMVSSLLQSRQWCHIKNRKSSFSLVKTGCYAQTMPSLVLSTQRCNVEFLSSSLVKARCYKCRDHVKSCQLGPPGQSSEPPDKSSGSTPAVSLLQAISVADKQFETNLTDSIFDQCIHKVYLSCSMP